MSWVITLDKGGAAGQVILHHHADHTRPKKAMGIQSLLHLLAEHLEGLAAGHG